MSDFVPNSVFLRGVLLHHFHMKKSAAESHRLLVEAYGEHALAEQTCRKWFARFKSGNFDLEDKERPGQPKKFQDEELKALINQDPCQTLKELSAALEVGESTVSKRLKTMGLVQKAGKWVPHELSERRPENPKKKMKSIDDIVEKKLQNEAKIKNVQAKWENQKTDTQ